MNSRVRPRERVELDGVQSLEDVELIALLLGTGHQGKEVESLAQRFWVWRMFKHPGCMACGRVEIGA